MVSFTMQNHQIGRFCAFTITVLRVKEELISSSSESDSDSDTEVVAILIKKFKKKPQRIDDYVEFTLENFTGKQFQEHFRITVDKYETVVRMLYPSLIRQGPVGRENINVEKQILSVIWLLATPDSYRSVGERFNMGKSSLSVCFMRMVKAICEKAPQIIAWPSHQQRIEIQQHFQRMGGLPNIIGAVDGTYINMKAPKNDAEVYVTRKCTYAFTLQAVCDPKLKFTDAFVGYPGSVNDNRIFRNSYIFHDIQNDPDRFISENQYIIGDKAYPLLTWCIPPYINRGNLTPAKIFFNQQQAKTRQTIERSFALLFGRFRRLKYLDMNRTDMIPGTVLACCVLHNICLNREGEERYIVDGLQHVAINHADDELDIRNREHGANAANNEARMKRYQLCTDLFRERNRLR